MCPDYLLRSCPLSEYLLSVIWVLSGTGHSMLENDATSFVSNMEISHGIRTSLKA
jgi:hypothetical protein